MTSAKDFLLLSFLASAFIHQLTRVHKDGCKVA